MLLGRLGSGGMGRVYLARSPGGRMVAVKVIRANLAEDAGFRARFAREVAAARKVGGLFTAQVVDADLDGPVPWLVTAYVPSTSLSDAVERQGPLPSQSVLALAAGLAEGVSAIHAAGVIHRDLKPSNVLLAQDGPRIIDFGISSAAEATSLTGSGYTIGSPGFMSPEQAEGLTVGPASDIFSLAGVLIYAARGEGPFGSGDTAALLYRVVHGTPNLDQIPANIWPLISRSLSRDANRRPTATEFLAELTAAYPSAADLSDWLSPRLLGLSGQRAASGDTGSNRPGVAATLGPAFNAGAAEAAGVAGGGGVAGSMAAHTSDPAVGGNARIRPDQQGHSGQQSHLGQQWNSGSQGYSGAQGGAGGAGNQWWAAQQPGRASAGQPRKRPRWLLPAGGGAAILVVVVALVLALGGHSLKPVAARQSATPASSPSRGTSPTADATPTVGDLQLAQFQVGDCLTGSNMDLNTNSPWPKITLAVPCSQAHSAEVFYANSNFWANGGAYPGDGTITKDANAECDTAFSSYVGIPYSKSMYTWTNIVPDSSTWPTGDRALHCVAYYATPKQPAGAPITGSIKGTRR